MPPSPPPSERLFRAEALDAQRTQLLGQIVLTPKLSTLWMSLVAALLALAVIALLMLGSHTRRVTVSGQLMPAGGLIRVHTPQAACRGACASASCAASSTGPGSMPGWPACAARAASTR